MKNNRINFFAGVNGAKGFRSYFDSVIDEEERNKVFYLKGTPGNGKSTLIKKIAKHFEENNEDVEYIRCSSDPDSFDGIILKNMNQVIVDATSPHTLEPKSVALTGEIINLGSALNSELLIDKTDKINSIAGWISTMQALTSCFLKCAEARYDALERISKIYDIDEIVNDCNHKVMAIIEEVIEKNDFICVHNSKNKISNGRIRYMFASAITYKGIVNYMHEILNDIKNIIVIKAPVGVDLSEIMNNAAGRFADMGMDIKLFSCPIISCDKIEHLVCEEASFGIFTCNDFHNMNDISEEDIKENNKQIITIDLEFQDDEFYDRMYLVYLKMIKQDIKYAEEHLKGVKLLHDELEKCYTPHINFDRINAVAEDIINRIYTYKTVH